MLHCQSEPTGERDAMFILPTGRQVGGRLLLALVITGAALFAPPPLAATFTTECEAPDGKDTYGLEEPHWDGNLDYCFVSTTPTSTPAPTVTPTPVRGQIRFISPEVVERRGAGQTVTDALTPPAGVNYVELTHTGSRNFIVRAHRSDRTLLLVNTIGAYSGSRPLLSDKPTTFEIEADGAWTLTIRPLTSYGTPAISGVGDYVSSLFFPPDAGPWEIDHTGSRNFIVYFVCTGGTQLVQNEIGAVRASAYLEFARGPCFWVVRADGQWSLRPRG